MPLALITVEQAERDRWHAEVETGGYLSKRRVINAQSFDEVMAGVLDAYEEMTGAKADEPAPVVEPPRKHQGKR